MAPPSLYQYSIIQYLLQFILRFINIIWTSINNFKIAGSSLPEPIRHTNKYTQLAIDEDQ